MSIQNLSSRYLLVEKAVIGKNNIDKNGIYKKVPQHETRTKS